MESQRAQVGRAARSRSGRWAALVLAILSVLALLYVIAGRSAVPSAASPSGSQPARAQWPSGPPGSVTVDLGNGAGDPVVQPDPATIDQLYLMVDDRLAADEAEPGEAGTGTGFSGFVVTSPSSARPLPTLTDRPALLVTPDSVYFVHAGRSLRLPDATGTVYSRLWAATTPLLDAATRAKLPAVNPGTPTTVSASVPPLVGVVGTWQPADPGDITPAARSVVLRVTRMECASGRTGKILIPVVAYAETEIVIRTDAEPRHAGADTCQSNDAVTVTVRLAEPVGNRVLLDAACLAGEAVSTAACADGATRWRP